MVDEVPSNEPATVAVESANSALSRLRISPFSSTKPALLVTPIKVPDVSNKSTNKKAKITLIMAISNAPAISSCINVGAIGGGIDITPANGT